MPRKKRITKKMLFTKTIEILQPWMNLHDWKIVVKFCRRMKATADCEAMPEYKEAVIRVHMPTLKMLSHEQIISTAVHELIHCISWPLCEYALFLCRSDVNKLEMMRKLEEGMVTHFERVFTYLAAESLQKELSAMGYYQIDMAFKELEIQHEQ